MDVIFMYISMDLKKIVLLMDLTHPCLIKSSYNIVFQFNSDFGIYSQVIQSELRYQSLTEDIPFHVEYFRLTKYKNIVFSIPFGKYIIKDSFQLQCSQWLVLSVN